MNQFRDRDELRRFMPPRLPLSGKERYLYLVRFQERPRTVKIGYTSHFKWRMNDYGWFGVIGPVMVSPPLTSAREREKELIATGNRLCGRSLNSRSEEFRFRKVDRMDEFIRCFIDIATHKTQPAHVMKTVLGACSICGGQVCVPHVWHGVNPPVPQCVQCHAVAANHGPVIPMQPQAA